MYISIATIKEVAAMVVIFTAVFSAYKWYLKQNKQDKDIKAMTDEEKEGEENA